MPANATTGGETMKATVERIARHIKEQEGELIDFLAQLVAIESTTYHEGEAVAFHGSAVALSDSCE